MGRVREEKDEEKWSQKVRETDVRLKVTSSQRC